LLAALPWGRWRDGAATARQRLMLALVSALTCVLVPAVFVGARCRHDAARLDELIDQERIREAHALAEDLARLDPWRRVRDQPVANVEVILGKEVNRLESRVAAALSPDAGPAERLERGRDLARLGRTQQALETLTPLTGADAEILRGAIHEARGDWPEGVAAYERAWTDAERSPASDARDAQIKTAITGIAYCQRKAGHYDQAEITYMKLLELAPTAETHFLLARFYDDAQDAQKAHRHARRAMELAPGRYREPGEILLRKMRTSQFGCMRVQ
jgi:tetratricopeptide (TPR) repeat protein